MPVNRIENINFDQTNLTEDGVLGGGSASIGVVPINTVTNTFVFTIKSNENSFTTKVNGQVVANSKQLRISRDELSKNFKKVEVSKTGYISDEYYIIEMLDDNSPVIINSKIETPLGLSTKSIALTKYKNNQQIGLPQFINNDVSVELDFTFNKVSNADILMEQITKYNLSFSITGKGSPVSVLKNNNKSAEFFPKIGLSTYNDISGTSYKLRSSNLSLYRITKLIVTNQSESKLLTANVGESLEIDITLNDDYSIDIITEEVQQEIPALNPQIELVNKDTKTYNINSEVGVPLMFRKNKDVQAITVIIGDDVLEFDDLDKGDLCGITIPHSSFKKIGKYNIKVYPFSFDDYEKQVRPQVPADTIEPKKVTPKFDVTEEISIEQPKAEDIYNPYNPTSVGSGGGGSRVPIVDFINQTNNKPIPNGGSFVNRIVDNRNIK